MSRGLGTRQRAVLTALRGLDSRSPGRWWSPADVIGVLAVPVRPAVVEPDPEPSPDERLILAQLETCRRLVALGHYEYAGAVDLAERRLASARVAREDARRARAAVVEREARQKAASRYPNQRRPEPRGGEAGNPARVFAALAARGLVERVAIRGPGSVVRIAVG